MKSIKTSLPSTAIVVMPIPKFFNGRGCCDNSDHVTNVRDPNFKSDMLKVMAVGKNGINRALVASGRHLVRAINVAPKLSDALSSTLMGVDGSSATNPGILPLDQYKQIVDEAIETATNTRAKRAQYAGQDRASVYTRNVETYRAEARERRSENVRKQSAPSSEQRHSTRDRPYYTGSERDDRNRHRSDPSVTDSNTTGNTSYAGQSYSSTRERSRHRSEPNAPAEQSSSRREPEPGYSFGARDIRYMTEEELEEDRRRREYHRSGARSDSAGASASAVGQARLTGTASRRGRGGLHNLGRYTKNF